jgi:formiminotetrahydrofolate cyclodeaminase
MQKALVKCTESPYHVMELCVQARELTDSLLGKTNASALSDLGVSALSLGAGLRGAWLNVLINIGSLKDRAAADHFRSSGKALLDRGMELSEEIYRKVEAAL